MIYDIYIMIFSFLDVKSWASTRLVCRYFREICETPALTNCILNMENASKTWKSFIFLGDSDGENLHFFLGFIEDMFIRECICLNPFKSNVPPYLCWFFKQDLKEIVSNVPSALKYRDSERNYILDKSFHYINIKNAIFRKALHFFIEKRNYLTPIEMENPDNPLLKLKMNILFNMQDKLSLLNVHSFNIRAGLNDSYIRSSCFRGDFDSYIYRRK